MPGSLDIDVTQKLRLSGTSTIYDQAYDIDSIDFDLGWADAFLMDLVCRSAKEGRQ